LQAHPNNTALLQEYIVSSILLDNIYGDQGMQGAVEQWEKILESRPGVEPALVRGLLRAQAWSAAGRLDLARAAAAAAVKADPKHLPSLLLAADLELQAEDWDASLKYARAAEAVDGKNVDAKLRVALALLGQGKDAQARKIYE